MDNVSIKLFFGTAAILVVTLQPLRADTLLSGPGDGLVSSTSTADIGYSFTVGSSPLLVTALGLWDYTGWHRHGSFDAPVVSILTADGTVLGSVTMSARPGGPRDGAFRYTPLSASLTLAPGETYVLEADYFTSRNRFTTDSLSQMSGIFSSAGTFDSSWLADGDSPDPGYTDKILVGPNLEFTVIPEPSITWIASIGAMVVLVLNRPVLSSGAERERPAAAHAKAN